MDSGGQLKVSGFGLLRLSNISHDKAKLAKDHIDPSNIYMAPEVYKNLIVDRSVDVYSFGVMLYEMIEGATPFHSMPAEEAVKSMCLEGKRPTFKTWLRSYPPDLRELIEECWDPEPLVRPIFSEIIVRLDRIVASCSKHGWLKDTFKLHWYASTASFFNLICSLYMFLRHFMPRHTYVLHEKYDFAYAHECSDIHTYACLASLG
ncbi:hypothetical protein V6N13_060569 [Hibiscus sabdariffa]